MTTKDSIPPSGSAAALGFGQKQTDAAVELQRELLSTYEKASAAWVARVKQEVEFWSGVAAKLVATRSAPEAIETYSKSVAQRMQMTADDGQRLLEERQEISKKFTQAMGNRWPSGST
jgi:hypothetical protein